MSGQFRSHAAIGDMSYEEWKNEKKSESNPIMLQRDKGEAIAESYRREYRGYGKSNKANGQNNISTKQTNISVTEEYVKNSTPGIGKIKLQNGYNEKNHTEEKKIADWIFNTFGGEIELLAESGKGSIPDYMWNNHLWELKTISTNNPDTIDKRIQKACKQINNNPGGIILDINNSLSEQENMDIVAEKALHRVRANTDFIVKQGNNYQIIRIEKR